jgi:hypothetical protein
MPHDPEDVIQFAMKEHARLVADNDQLRATIAAMAAEIRKIAAELGKLIDKDNH